MSDLVIGFFGIVVGVTATIAASRYYYDRTTKKMITPFIQMQSNVLSDVDREVRKDINIEYKGVNVENLQQLQFLVANTGERAIKNTISPLRLEMPDCHEVMDASILYVSPQSREVRLVDREWRNSVEIEFPLLNKDDFFILKILVKGEPKIKDLKFFVAAEDLPPELEIKRLTYKQIDREEKGSRSIDKQDLVAGIFMIFTSVSIFLVSYSASSETFIRLQIEGMGWLNDIPLFEISSVLSYFAAAITMVAGCAALISSFFQEFEFPKKRKFKLPIEYHSSVFGLQNNSRK